MKLKSTLFKLSLSSLIMIGACSNDNLNNFMVKKSFPPLTDSDMKIDSDSKIVGANNKFGIKLFSELLKTDKNKNLFISPTSVLFALSMTYNGADGTTKESMEKTLELTGMTTDEINKSNNALIRTLINSDPSVRLDIANSLWAKKEISFNPEFVKTNENYYKAITNSLDFSSPDSVKIINQWVSDSTQKKIEKIVEKINPDDILFLINAIYFKGNWTNKFDKNLTKSETFNLLDNKTKQVQMMSLNEELRYYKDAKFQAVSLPYGKENISMYVFLPNSDSSLEEFNKTLTDDTMKTWFTNFKKTQGQIKLPKFKLEYEKSLNETLKSLGMEDAFSSNANFSKLFKANSSNSAVISEVKHKTFVEVNEEGTEAAAATNVEVALTSALVSIDPFKMVVDRPFVYLIRDNKSGTVLFMGEVVDPA